MSHLEKRANLWYAALTVPADVRPIIGKLRFVQSTKTANESEAKRRAGVLVAGWKGEIAKARGKAANPKDSFWDSLRNQHINTEDHGIQFAVETQARALASKVKDPEKASHLYKYATNQLGTLLAPLVEDWKGSLRLAQKTIDQQHRDVSRMAEHFVSVEALQPQKVKAWTDKLLAAGTTASSFERLGHGCRSFWAYLQQSGTKAMIDPDPFAGAFKLALRVAVKNKTGRTGNAYTAEDLTRIYVAAVQTGDKPLADLIALGAYTGARIEELGKLTKGTVKDGMFIIEKSKTSAGIRQCPIHPAIVPLVARMLKDSTDGYLVPSSTKNQYGERASALGKKYGRLKTSLGFKSDLAFHSTRNTLITLMEQAGVPEGIAADVAGHDKKTMTYGLYSGGSSMIQKLDAISKVKYPGALGSP